MIPRNTTNCRLLPRRILLLAVTLLLSSLSLSQATVNATLIDGTGTIYRTAYLHSQLVNCGANIPVVTGTEAIIQDSFDLRPSSPGCPLPKLYSSGFLGKLRSVLRQDHSQPKEAQDLPLQAQNVVPCRRSTQSASLPATLKQTQHFQRQYYQC